MATTPDATKPQDGQIGVRMYNVGFGDCFLISFPTKKGMRRMLVDCGSMGKANLSIADIARQVIADVTDANGKAAIDVVVATHRHRDHVSGFAAKEWRDVDVHEVWMPWTEDPNDPSARKIRNGQTSFAMGMQKQLAATASPLVAKKLMAVAEDMELDATDLFSMARNKRGGPPALAARNAFLALNAASNPEAMATLHDGFAGSPERFFLPEKTGDKPRARSFSSDRLPSVKISILGPSRDLKVMRSLEPPDGQSYFRLASGEAASANGEAPFAREWVVQKGSKSIAHLKLDPGDLKALEEAAAGDMDALAAANDGKLNGTSLVLVVEFEGVHLLLAGDAQWGTWEAAVNDPEWNTLLSKTRFFKVGHHGSHNASPKKLVDGLLGKRGDMLAMVSTRQFGSWDIPREPLLDALAKRRAKIARSDKRSAKPFKTYADWVDLIIPTS